MRSRHAARVESATLCISVIDATGRARRHRLLLRRVVEAALRRHRIRRADIRVAVVDDKTMALLNLRHLGHPGPTDVLTFDLHQTGPHSRSKAPAILDADIAVSYDTARREARRRRHPPAAELALYTLHGVLHLLGYDDQRQVAAVEMHQLEDVILAALGVGVVYARETR
jgi:probable rRNA maturation factor